MSQRHLVLLVAGMPVDVEQVARLVQRLESAGWQVALASQQPVDTDLSGAGTRALVSAAGERGPRFRRQLRAAADPAERLWVHVREDTQVNRWAQQAEIIVWLDARARVAAQRLGQRHEVPVQARDELHGESSPTVLTQQSMHRLRRLLSGARRLRSPKWNIGPEAGSSEVHTRLLAGEADAANALLRSQLEKITDLRERADLLGDVTSWCLAHGLPTSMVRETYAAELDVADRHYAAGEIPEAAASVAEAIRTAFHPVVHFDTLLSPLAEDPVGFTAAWQTSRVAAALREPSRDQAVGRPSAATVSALPQPECDRRTSLVIATQHNADFLHEIRAYFGNHPDFDTRFAMFTDSLAVKRYAKAPARYVEDVLANKPELTESLERTFRANLEGVDVLFVEWCGALAAMVSQMDTGDTRVVVRLHSFEVFTGWPQITNFGGIDDVVFVSEHLRDVAVAAIPGLSGSRAPRLHVIANAMELGRFPRPKAAETRFTLGVVGASKMVKDPRWAIEVLSHLRRTDDRYRLLLLRGNLQEETVAAREYAAALRQEIAQLPAGSVTVLGHADDVPAVLEEVGVVVSSSLRESFHMGLVEGVASGALPVVRDWPFFPGAARSLFPNMWVVDSPEAAARRILALTQDEQRWREETSIAADWVMERWDWPVVRREFEQLFRS